MSGSSWFLTRTTAIDRVLTSDGASTNSKRLCTNSTKGHVTNDSNGYAGPTD
jgi:hypothetical protein